MFWPFLLAKWVIFVFARNTDFGAKSGGTDFAMSKNRFCLHTDFAGKPANLDPSFPCTVRTEANLNAFAADCEFAGRWLTAQARQRSRTFFMDPTLMRGDKQPAGAKKKHATSLLNAQPSNDAQDGPGHAEELRCTFVFEH